MARFVAFVAIIACCFPQSGKADELTDYLGKDGKLTKKLVFADALTTPTTWDGCRFEISPSGDWAKYCGRFPDPVSKGKLDQKQISALGQCLAAQNFGKLPKVMGWTPKAEPGKLVGYVAGVVSISFGEKETRFYTQKSKYEYLGQPGTSEANEWLRFVSIELLLRDLLKDDSPKKESK